MSLLKWLFSRKRKADEDLPNPPKKQELEIAKTNDVEEIPVNWSDIFQDFWVLVLDQIENEYALPLVNFALVCKKWNTIFQKHPLLPFKKYLFNKERLCYQDIEFLIKWDSFLNKNVPFTWPVSYETIMCFSNNRPLCVFVADEFYGLIARSFMIDQKKLIQSANTSEDVDPNTRLPNYFQLTNVIQKDLLIVDDLMAICKGRLLGSYRDETIKSWIVKNKRWSVAKRLKTLLEPYNVILKLW